MSIEKVLEGISDKDANALGALLMAMMPEEKKAQMEDLAINKAVEVIVESAHKVGEDCSRFTNDSANAIIVMKRAAQILLQDCISQILGSFHSGLPASEARDALEAFMDDVAKSVTLKFWDAEPELFAAHLIEARNEARRQECRDDDMEIVPAAYRDIVTINEEDESNAAEQ